MAASTDYTERCHTVLVRGLWSTRSFAVSTLVFLRLLIIGHLAPMDSHLCRHKSTRHFSCVLQFLCLDVISVHADYINYGNVSPPPLFFINMSSVLSVLIFSTKTNIAFQSCDIYIYIYLVFPTIPTMVATIEELWNKRTVMVLYRSYELTDFAYFMLKFHPSRLL